MIFPIYTAALPIFYDLRLNKRIFPAILENYRRQNCPLKPNGGMEESPAFPRAILANRRVYGIEIVYQ